MPSDLRTQAIILRRTNYGEADRILNFLTPSGKISALAHGVRKEKSRLAGSIELFSVVDIVVHEGRGTLSTLTSARTVRFYHHILSNLPRLEIASNCLKQANRASDQADNPEFFTILDQALAALDQDVPLTIVSTWFRLNLARASGEEINLLFDVAGADLQPDLFYVWDSTEFALRAEPRGLIGAKQIKLARLMLEAKLKSVSKIEQVEQLLTALEPVAQSFMPRQP